LGWVILLFAAGGYAPQMSVHAFLGLAALWLLVNFEAESEAMAGQTSRGEAGGLRGLGHDNSLLRAYVTTTANMPTENKL
jgi:hypothetical protein